MHARNTHIVRITHSALPKSAIATAVGTNKETTVIAYGTIARGVGARAYVENRDPSPTSVRPPTRLQSLSDFKFNARPELAVHSVSVRVSSRTHRRRPYVSRRRRVRYRAPILFVEHPEFPDSGRELPRIAR